LLVIYVAQRGVELSATLGRPRFNLLPRTKLLRVAGASA
jgi:hypothetical protein